jgi:hypothetical protein
MDRSGESEAAANKRRWPRTGAEASCMENHSLHVADAQSRRIPTATCGGLACSKYESFGAQTIIQRFTQV